MFVSPGRLVHDYWNGRTLPYYNPFRYVLIWTAINVLFSFWLGIDDIMQANVQPEMVEDIYSDEQIDSADQQFDSWLNALVILMLPIFSLLTYWLFRKAKKNYGEHLIMNSFMMGQQSMISIFTLVLLFLFPKIFTVFMILNFLIGLSYNTYCYHNIFKEKVIITFLKCLSIGIIGLVVFFSLISLASFLAFGVS